MRSLYPRSAAPASGAANRAAPASRKLHYCQFAARRRSRLASEYRNYQKLARQVGNPGLMGSQSQQCILILRCHLELDPFPNSFTCTSSSRCHGALRGMPCVLPRPLGLKRARLRRPADHARRLARPGRHHRPSGRRLSARRIRPQSRPCRKGWRRSLPHQHQ